MDKKEFKIEKWCVCERYRNYKSNNYYKDPVQFRPHPENVVRDVVMYHIYHNEGKLYNDDLVQYIKNKIINDLDVIFMLYQYAPDTKSMIKRLMSSKSHLGSKETYNEMTFHALTINDVREVLIEQISNVLITHIPEPLGNVKFDVTMKNTVKEETDMSDKNQQRFKVGDLVSFEEDGWYYQSLIHGVCYHKESKQWSYVIVVFNEFRRIWSSSDVDKLTLLKKSETSIDTDVQNNNVVKRKRVYRGYITKSREIKETLLMAAKLIEGISEDDILNRYTLDDYSCDIIETTYNFIRTIINYVCSYSDNDYVFDEDKGYIVQLKDNGNQRIDTPLYEFIKFEFKPILVEQMKKVFDDTNTKLTI